MAEVILTQCIIPLGALIIVGCHACCEDNWGKRLLLGLCILNQLLYLWLLLELPR